MNILRNRFLATAAFLSSPNDPPAGGTGKPTVMNEDVGAEDDNAGGDDGAAGRQDGGGAGDGESGDGERDDGGADDESVDPADDDDPELADLPPEAKAKAKAAIERRIAKETGWRDRQLSKLHGKLRSSQEDNRTLETIADPQRGSGTQQQQDPNRKFTQDEVRAEAARMSAQERYDADCNDAFTKGASAYGDKWKGALDKLPKLGGVDVSDMTDIVSTEQPHVVFYQLSDPDTYDRVMSLPPARRRTEFVKLSLKEAPKPKGEMREDKRPGDQPAPVRQISGSRKTAAQTVNLHDDKVADDAWYAERNRTRRKKFGTAE